MLLKYLKDYPEIEQFLILDYNFIIDLIREHEIYLNLCVGLQEKHIIPAIEILIKFKLVLNDIELDRFYYSL